MNAGHESFQVAGEGNRNGPSIFWKRAADLPCCWCAVEEGNLILQPHPLSPARVRILPLSEGVEVIGQVVAVAMRLDPFAENF